MKKLAIGVVGLLGLALIGAGGLFLWAGSAAQSVLDTHHEVHEHAVTVPTEPEELAAAVARGQHLVEAIYACSACHGADFGGGVMVDAAPMGTWRGPNLTGGEGSVTASYTPADWDRIVRHGVQKDGTAAIMPSEDFVEMSDQELADIIAYLDTVPDVAGDVEPSTLGPVSRFLYAFGAIEPSALRFASRTEHAAVPPDASDTLAYGAHLARMCTGCHREDFSGGPISSGDPSWPPAANLTRGEGGVRDRYDAASFAVALRTGTKPDGSSFRDPMSLLPPYNQHLTEEEMAALWAFIDSVPPRATGL